MGPGRRVRGPAYERGRQPQFLRPGRRNRAPPRHFATRTPPVKARRGRWRLPRTGTAHRTNRESARPLEGRGPGPVGPVLRAWGRHRPGRQVGACRAGRAPPPARRVLAVRNLPVKVSRGGAGQPRAGPTGPALLSALHAVGRQGLAQLPMRAPTAHGRTACRYGVPRPGPLLCDRGQARTSRYVRWPPAVSRWHCLCRSPPGPHHVGVDQVCGREPGTKPVGEQRLRGPLQAARLHCFAHPEGVDSKAVTGGQLKSWWCRITGQQRGRDAVATQGHRQRQG